MMEPVVIAYPDEIPRGVADRTAGSEAVVGGTGSTRADGVTTSGEA
jgi:hypothetical protein